MKAKSASKFFLDLESEVFLREEEGGSWGYGSRSQITSDVKEAEANNNLPRAPLSARAHSSRGPSSSSSSSSSSGSITYRPHMRPFVEENQRLRLLLQNHIERLKEKEEGEEEVPASESEPTQPLYAPRPRHRYNLTPDESPTRPPPARSRRRAKSAPKRATDHLCLEIQRIRDAKIAKALNSAESGTTGVCEDARSPARRSQRANSSSSSSSSSLQRLYSSPLPESDDMEEEACSEEADESEEQDDDLVVVRRRRPGSMIQLRPSRKRTGVHSDQTSTSDDEGGSYVDYSSASSLRTRDYSAVSSGNNSEQGELGSDSLSDSYEGHSSDDDGDTGDEQEQQQKQERSKRAKDRKKKLKQEEQPRKGSFKERINNFYSKSLFREQQRLSSGLITPRLDDRRSRTAELPQRRSMLVTATPDWGDARTTYEYRPLYWHSAEWRAQQRQQGQLERSPKWKLLQASDYELFNEFRSFKAIVQTPRGGYKAEAVAFGQAAAAKTEAEPAAVAQAPASSSSDEKSAVSTIVGDGPRGSTSSTVPLYDSLGFKALLRKESQRIDKHRQLDAKRETTRPVVVDLEQLANDDWKRGLKIVLKEGKETILGGEVDRLMSHLADCSVQDRQFVEDFLCSFRSFVEPEELLDFLISRYNMPPPDGGSAVTSEASVGPVSPTLYEKHLPLLQLRVLNVLRKWLAAHFYDFEEEPRLLARLLHFVENTLRVHQPNEQHYEAIKSLILEQAQEVLVNKDSPLSEIVVVMEREDLGVNTQIFHKKAKKYVRSFNGMDFVDWCRDKLGVETTADAIALGNKMIQQGIIRTLEKRDRRSAFNVANDLFYRFSRGGQLTRSPPVPRIPSRLPTADALELMDVDAIELARQFTLYSELLYRQITPTRLVGYMLAHRKMAITPSFLGIFNFLNRWDEVAKWATREVLSYSTLAQRAAALRKLIHVAKACFGYNNFFDMSAILCGLNHSSINRLKKTWKVVHKKERKVFDELSTLISPDNSYKLLREMQREAWSENFNRAERYTVGLGHDDDSGDEAHSKRRRGAEDEDVYGLIPYIAIYIIDLEHLSQVPETIEGGLVNFAKRRIEASIFAEMIKFREHKYNFVPIEPYRRWVENIPQRGYSIFVEPQPGADGGETSPSGGKGRKGSWIGRRGSPNAIQQTPPWTDPKAEGAVAVGEEAAQRRQDNNDSSGVHERGGDAIPSAAAQPQVVPYDDKHLWQVSLRLEPRDP